MWIKTDSGALINMNHIVYVVPCGGEGAVFVKAFEATDATRNYPHVLHEGTEETCSQYMNKMATTLNAAGARRGQWFTETIGGSDA